MEEPRLGEAAAGPEARRSLAPAGWAGIGAAVVAWVVLVTEYALFTGSPGGHEHDLHWVSHLLGSPAALLLVGALAGVAVVEWSSLGALGRGALVVCAVSAVPGVVGGLLVGWAGGVQGSTDGGLWDLGHGIGDLGALGLPAQVVLGLVLARRAVYLPRWSGVIPVAAIPVAIIMGITLGAMDRDAGLAMVVVLGSTGLQLLVWGVTMARGASSDQGTSLLVAPRSR